MQVWLLPLVVMLASTSATWATIGAPFIARHDFSFSITQNLLVGCAQGLVYIAGASASTWVGKAVGRKQALLTTHLILTALLLVMRSDLPAWAFVALLLTYTFTVATTWPLTASWHCEGATGPALARRVQIYNLCWATTGAVAIAVQGSVGGTRRLLLLAATLHLIAFCLVALRKRTPVSAAARNPSAEATAEEHLDQHRLRTGLILARTGLPASYMVIYALAPLLDGNATMQSLGPQLQTFVASLFMGVRALAFLLLGHVTFWHRKPGVLIIGLALMGVCFLALTVPLHLTSRPTEVTIIVLAETLLGVTLGLIYMASLYFGMAISGSDSRQSGYHEALIGLGNVLGPGATAATTALGFAAFWPVAVAITLCTTAGTIAWKRLGRG